MNQAELVQPPSMMEKQAKTLKPKSDKKLKVAESAAPEGSPAHTQPAQTIEGTFLLIADFHIQFLGFYKCEGDFRRF